MAITARRTLARTLPTFQTRAAVEACTGWRYVAEELAAAGAVAHLGEPAETAALRGPKRRPKTDWADARHLRELLDSGRLPECWIPRAIFWSAGRCWNSTMRCGWSTRPGRERVHAVCFHQGVEALGSGALSTAQGLDRLAQVSGQQLSAAGRLQVQTALAMLGALEERLDLVRRQLLAASRHLHGARVLHQQLYGVGAITALALVCWLGGAGRFSSTRKAVRFCGLDVTVYASAGKRAPGGCHAKALGAALAVL